MRSKFLLLALLPLLFVSCDEESCKDTEQSPISFSVYYSVFVKNLHQAKLPNEPVTVTFQKWWCSGDFSIITSHSGTTDNDGNVDGTTSYQITLENTLDYLLVTWEVGAGDYRKEEAAKFYYDDINITGDGEFLLPISFTLNK